jgi:plasmid stabilization system protein ParE
MAFRVEISAQAERDAEAILDWLLTQHPGQAGIDWFLALDDAIASLAELPERCPIAPENTRFPFEVRQLFYGRKDQLPGWLLPRNVQQLVPGGLHLPCSWLPEHRAVLSSPCDSAHTIGRQSGSLYRGGSR